jgi:hypothetical protein
MLLRLRLKSQAAHSALWVEALLRQAREMSKLRQ